MSIWTNAPMLLFARLALAHGAVTYFDLTQSNGTEDMFHAAAPFKFTSTEPYHLVWTNGPSLS